MRLAFWRKTVTPRVEGRDIPRDDIARTIYAAADLIESKGWVRGAMHNQNGYCALGALTEVAKKNQTTLTGSGIRLIDYLDATGRGESISLWNDHIAGDKEDVLITLREAANYKVER